MARKTLLTGVVENQKEEKVAEPIEILEDIIPKFKKVKEEVFTLKKEESSLKDRITSIMGSSELEEFEVGDIKATYKNQPKETFNEEKLIEKLKELKIRGVIKKKEYVDEDALESAIYNGKLNAAELAACREIKDVWVLRLGKVK